MKWTPPYKCLYCGAPSWREPSDQSPPSDYCHEENHGTPDLVDDTSISFDQMGLRKPWMWRTLMASIRFDESRRDFNLFQHLEDAGYCLDRETIFRPNGVKL